MRAIADRAGGDPGFVGLAGDVDLSRRAKPTRLGRPARPAAGARPPKARARRSPARGRQLATAGIELRGRADDPDIEAVEQAIADALPLTQAINAWEGRWPLNTYADLDAGKLSAPARERLKTAEAMTQRDYGELIARRAAVRATYAKAASRYDAFVTLGACGAAPVGLGIDRQHHHERRRRRCSAARRSRCRCCRTKACRSACSLLGGMDRDAALFEIAAGWRASRSTATIWWGRLDSAWYSIRARHTLRRHARA